MNLHNTLKTRLAVAKSFTKKFQEEVKRSVKDYKAEDTDAATLMNLDYVETVNTRYKFTIPLIFTNQEAMLASLFDRVPDLVISQGGVKDAEKANKVQAAYRYLTDKLSIQWFMNDAAWWFILVGFAAAHARYKQESETVPVIDETTGEPQIDPMTGEQMMREMFTYDDPILEVGDPLKEYWSPESKFTVKGDKIPYYFREELMSVDQVKEVYGKKVEPDAVLENASVEDKKSENSADFKRVKVYFYYGDVPTENKGEVKEWSSDAPYYIVLTDKEVLYKNRMDDKYCKLIKWYGAPNEFFGFGIGKVLRNFQREKSLRRGQQMRYADIAAFAKLLLPAGTTIDEKSANDPRENPTLFFDGEKPPSYLVPPDMSNTLQMADQKVDEDAQRASGMMDISTGGQKAGVDTATGQSIFAEASERRMRQAKRKFVEFYEQVIIMLLKLAQKNWQESKMVKITDDDGEEQSVEVTSDDLKDIDFDTDIHIDGESVTYNKDVLRSQAIEFYNMTKDDPLVNRKPVIADTMKDAFNKSNPERYIQEPPVAPGSILTDQTGQQFTVDETGSLVSAPMQQSMGIPTGDTNVASDPSAIQGQVNTL